MSSCVPASLCHCPKRAPGERDENGGHTGSWSYLKDVLEKIAGDWPQRELDRLLPDAWAAEHPKALRRSRPA